MTRAIHRIFCVTLLLAAMLFLVCPYGLAAEAAAGPADQVLVEGNTVTLVSTHMAAERICSVQLTLNVGEGAAFTFDPQLAGSRMTASAPGEGTVTLYIVGTEPLMSGDRLVLGTITGGAPEETALAEGSLKYVYGKRSVVQNAAQADELSPEENARELLEAAIEAADSMYGGTEAHKYTEESWDALLQAVETARELSKIYSASNEQLIEALNDLAAAVENLQFTAKAGLEDAIARARSLSAGGYTAASYAALQTALSQAESAMTSVDDEQMKAAWEALDKAIDGLVPYAGADSNGPTIGDGPDDGTSPGWSEPTATPEPTEVPATASPEPSATPGPSASPEPSIMPRIGGEEAQTTAAAAPTAVPAAGGPAAPATGDETVFLPWALMLCVSGALLAALLIGRHTRQHK